MEQLERGLLCSLRCLHCSPHPSPAPFSVAKMAMSTVNHESIGKSGDANAGSGNSTSAQRLRRASGRTWLEEMVEEL